MSAIPYQVKYGINFEYYIITYIRPSNHFTRFTNTFTSIGKILKKQNTNKIYGIQDFPFKSISIQLRPIKGQVLVINKQ